MRIGDWRERERQREFDVTTFANSIELFSVVLFFPWCQIQEILI